MRQSRKCYILIILAFLDLSCARQSLPDGETGFSRPNRLLTPETEDSPSKDLNQEHRRVSRQQSHSRRLKQIDENSSGDIFTGSTLSEASLHPTWEAQAPTDAMTPAPSPFMLQASFGPSTVPRATQSTLPILQKPTTSAPQPAFAPPLLAPGPSPIGLIPPPKATASTPVDEPAKFVWTAAESPPSSDQASTVPSPTPTNFSASPEPNQIPSPYASGGDKTEVKLGTVAIVLICLGIFVAVLVMGVLYAMLVRMPQWQDHFASCFNCCFGAGSSSGNHIRAFAGIPLPRKKVIIRPPPLPVRRPSDALEGCPRDCEICCEQFKKNSAFVVFACEHSTCKQCYDKIMHKDQQDCLCPFCRVSLLEAPKTIESPQVSTDGAVPGLGQGLGQHAAIEMPATQTLDSAYSAVSEFSEIDLSVDGGSEADDDDKQ